jgi:hypothetical protein
METKHDDKRLQALLSIPIDQASHLIVMKEIMASVIILGKVRQDTPPYRIQRTVFFEAVSL